MKRLAPAETTLRWGQAGTGTTGGFWSAGAERDGLRLRQRAASWREGFRFPLGLDAAEVDKALSGLRPATDRCVASPAT